MVRPRDTHTGDPLLCELHCHSTWSDGALAIPELVDLYGGSGFDVLCITDHVVRGDGMVTAERFGAYLDAIRREARRARADYGLVLIPGLELTWDDPDETRAAHAVAIGVERFVTLDHGLDRALADAARQRAAIVAVHPACPGVGSHAGPDDEAVVDRPGAPPPCAPVRADQPRPGVPVGGRRPPGRGRERRLPPAGASGDVKTLLPARRDAHAVIDYLRSPLPAFLTRHSASTVAARARDAEVAGFPV